MIRGIIISLTLETYCMAHAPGGIEDPEQSSKVLRSVRQMDARTSVAQVLNVRTRLHKHVRKHLRVAGEQVGLDSERCVLTDENDVAAPEVEPGVLRFAKLRCSLARVAIFICSLIHRFVVPVDTV